MRNLTYSVLLTLIAVVCFVICFLLSVNVVHGNFDAWLSAGLAFGFASHLPLP